MRAIKDCSVCVVGGAGFLGSHLVNHLIDDRNCRVLMIDNLITGRHEFIHPRATFEHHDITGSESYLLKLFRQYQIKYVFNYAAEPYIPVSFERPLHVFNINAFGALKVINAAQEAECEGILQVSSAEIYGEGARHHDSDVDSSKKIDELDAVVPHSSYGAAKAAIDAMVQVRWKEAKTPVIALRQFNCVGERETHPYIVPEIVGQIFHGGPPIRLGNNSFRDFLYAGDAVRMAVELLEKGQFGEVYNLGSESGIKIYDLARLLCEIVSDGVVKGNDAEIVEDARRKRPWEIWHLQSNNAKIHSVIETRPTVSLEEALRRTVNYYLVSGKKWCWE